MKKAFSKKWALLCISLAMAAAVALACAGGDWPEYGDSAFTPEAFVDSSYSPFFLSSENYYKIGYDKPADDRFKDANADEWSNWFAEADPGSLVTRLLYDTRANNIDSLLQTLPAGGLRKSKKFPLFLQYLRLAKTSETYSSYLIEEWWEYANSKRKIDNNLAFAMAAKWSKAMQSEKDVFLKKRDWFQLVRAYFFAGKYPEAVIAFDDYASSATKDRMFYRTMAYAAGALYKQQQYARANYLYSLVFTGLPEMRVPAHYSFHPQEESDWNQSLALCRSNAEQATLWQMLGIFYGDAMRSIKAIQQLEPTGDKMDILLLRWVNAFEQSDEYFQVNRGSYDTAGRKNIAVIRAITDEGKMRNPALWQMATGYLAMMTGDVDEADRRFRLAAQKGSMTPLFAAQLRMLQLTRKLQAAPTINATIENACLPDLKWLLQMEDATPVDLRVYALRDKIRRDLSKRYRQQGELIKAECFYHGSVFFTDSNRTNQFLQFLEDKQKTPYANFCASLSKLKADDIYQYKAIVAAFQQKLPLALQQMEKSAARHRELPGNPFNARINDCHDCDHAAPQKVKYTHLDFLKKMRDMQAAIAQNREVYNNARLLGNAYYNITHFGNARNFYEGAIVGEGYSQPEYIDSSFRKMLTGMEPAIHYYQVALQAASTNEQRAQIQYLLAKCQRNQWFMRRDDNETRDFVNWDGFTQLRQYANTKYYQEVIRECGWFRP